MVNPCVVVLYLEVLLISYKIIVFIFVSQNTENLLRQDNRKYESCFV